MWLLSINYYNNEIMRIDTEIKVWIDPQLCNAKTIDFSIFKSIRFLTIFASIRLKSDQTVLRL
jgi:hypothetical protein